MTGLLALFGGVIVMVLAFAVAGFIFGAAVVRYKRSEGSPYRDKKELEALRQASVSEILSGVPRSGRKLLVLSLLACCGAFLAGDRGQTIGEVLDWIAGFGEPSVTDAVEEIYTRYRLMSGSVINEDGVEVEAPLTPSERALTAVQLMAWIDEYGSDNDYAARRNAVDERQVFLLRVLQERHSFDDSAALSDHILRGSGAVFGRDCDNSHLELGFLAMRALRESWPVSERAFRAVYDAMTTLECSGVFGSTYYEDEYRNAAISTLRYWREQHPEDFERIITRLHLGHQLER